MNIWSFSYSNRYYITHPWEWVRELWLSLKWFLQRGARGYSDCDVWGLDSYLASWMPQAIRSINKKGYPICGEQCGISSEVEENEKHWNEVLIKTARGFEIPLEQDELLGKVEPQDFQEAYEKLEKERIECFHEFGKHFNYLWD